VRVVDASVVVELICFDLDTDELGDEELAAPHLLDSEVLHAIRRHVNLGNVTEPRAEQALSMFEGLRILRYPAAPLRRRMWELRDNLSAYDATYVALAESLEATALLTLDDRLAKAPGLRCSVVVLA
jgi:predicted nucleic acid-binding protein